MTGRGDAPAPHARGAAGAFGRACAVLLALGAGPWLAGGPAHGQTDPARFRAFLASDAYRALVGAASDQIPAEILPLCPAFSSPGADVTIARDVTFGADGMPRSGAWWSRAPVSGCGNDTIINIFFQVGARGKITPLVALPGTTRADPVLQRDALMYAFLGVGQRMADCAQMHVIHTRFEAFGLQGAKPAAAKPAPSPPTAAEARGPWWETWIVSGCGRSFAVPMEFVPDATGTTINQRPADIVQR